MVVNSGTSALWLSLLAVGIGPGDEVIVPSFTFTFTATAAAAGRTGATCAFADIDPHSFCLDPDIAAQPSPAAPPRSSRCTRTWAPIIDASSVSTGSGYDPPR